MRAHATAVGLEQLTLELPRAGLLDGAAVDRIKDRSAWQTKELQSLQSAVSFIARAGP
jgi:hypothetical protein